MFLKGLKFFYPSATLQKIKKKNIWTLSNKKWRNINHSSDALGIESVTAIGGVSRVSIPSTVVYFKDGDTKCLVLKETAPKVKHFDFTNQKNIEKKTLIQSQSFHSSK